jgi:hypothetical protein
MVAPLVMGEQLVKIYIIVTYNGTAVLAAPIKGYKDIVPWMLLFGCTAATSHPRIKKMCCFKRDNLHLKNTPDVKQLRRMRQKRRIP